MAKARKSRKRVKKRTVRGGRKRTAKLKGRKVTARKARRRKGRKQSIFSRALDALREPQNLRTRLTSGNSFEDR